uniref:Uncharacterized protein n=1 Tax=Anguilla anguilla TaxID=7936 RepID=A0A0E9RGT1_ANGAN
MASIILSCTV